MSGIRQKRARLLPFFLAELRSFQLQFLVPSLLPSVVMSQTAQTVETSHIVDQAAPAAKPATPLGEKLTLISVGVVALGLTAGWLALLVWLVSRLV
jgi:hypothetical protein